MVGQIIAAAFLVSSCILFRIKMTAKPNVSPDFNEDEDTLRVDDLVAN